MKVKLFLGSKLNPLEKEINEFITDKNIDIADLKLSLNYHQVVCAIIYTEKE
jgi:hypothetical protein